MIDAFLSWYIKILYHLALAFVVVFLILVVDVFGLEAVGVFGLEAVVVVGLEAVLLLVY